MNVNALIVETPEEKRLYALGERNSQIRKERRNTSLIKHTPNDLESDLIHAFWQKQLQYHGQSLRICADVLLRPVKILMMSCESLITFISWIRRASRLPLLCSRNIEIGITL